MISGAAGPTGPGKPGLNVSAPNKFGPMTTNSFLQIGEHELSGTKDGWVAVQSTPAKDALRSAIDQANLASRAVVARRELQKHLEERGMTYYLPEPVAVRLADPIFQKRWRRTEGLIPRRRVDVTMVDLDGLAKQAGSQLMYSAFKEALADSPRYLLPGEYTGLLAGVFMKDPQMAVLWHMMGSGFINDEKKAELKQQGESPACAKWPTLEELAPRMDNLTSVVGKSELVTLKKTPQWRVQLGDVMPEVMGSDAAASFDESLLTAMNYLQKRDQLPTVVGVLNAAADVFKNGVDSLISNDKGNGSGDRKMSRSVELAAKYRFNHRI